MNYSGSLVFFDGTATTANSLGLVTLKLAQKLRDKSIPAAVSSYAGPSDPDFPMVRHLVGSPRQPVLSNVFGADAAADYIYIDAGQATKGGLSLAAKQSIVIIPHDDIRWSFKHYTRYLSKVDTILTFSKASQEYLTKKLKRPVGLLPLGVDRADYYPIDTTTPPQAKVVYSNFTIPVSSLANTYRFLSMGFMQERKGIKELLQAYYKGFYGNHNVSLWIHGRSGAWSDNSARELLRGFNNSNAPLLIWTDSALSTTQVNQLLNFCDCYISPHHLEGFGLMPLQALACNKAVIATGFSGPMDYLSHSNSYLIPAKDTTKMIDGNSLPWGEYKLSDLVELMRSLPEPKLQHIASLFSWDRSVRYLKQHLNAPGKILYPKDKGVTICVPCYKAAQKLDALLRSMELISAGASYQVLVGNDGSDPEVSKVCQKHHVDFISTPGRSVTAMRNLLAARVTTEWMVYLDADVVITSHNWLRDWITAHTSRNADFSTVLQFYPDGTVNASGHIGGSCNPCYKAAPTLQCYLPLKADYAQGSAMLGKSELFQTYPFYEGYTLYYDDYDYSECLRRHGKSIWYLPVTSLIHDANTTKNTIGLSESDLGETLFNSFWKA